MKETNTCRTSDDDDESNRLNVEQIMMTTETNDGVKHTKLI